MIKYLLTASIYTISFVAFSVDNFSLKNKTDLPIYVRLLQGQEAVGSSSDRSTGWTFVSGGSELKYSIAKNNTQLELNFCKSGTDQIAKATTVSAGETERIKTACSTIKSQMSVILPHSMIVRFRF